MSRSSFFMCPRCSAQRRVRRSMPVSMILDHGLLREGVSFLDYGCGYGSDVAALREQGIAAHGWDPCHGPLRPLARAFYEVVLLGHVLNAIEDEAKSLAVLADAWSLASSVLVVAVRIDPLARAGSCRTHRRYSVDSLALLCASLSDMVVVFGVGVAFVFRGSADYVRVVLALR